MENNSVKRITAGILAHVDAGKTTLSEGLLYCAGITKKLGRVDHGSSFLDNDEQERRRGITIFSKEARLTYNNMELTVLDTPGHVDFSAETERVFDVLDCGILVINSPEGVQSHTRTLWKLVRKRNIPVYVFANKMDLPGVDKRTVLNELSRSLEETFFDYKEPDFEALALACDSLMEEYLETGSISRQSITEAVNNCEVFPCWFGSALKMEGVEELAADLSEISREKEHSKQFGAKVYKISRDSRGNRITHMKINGGSIGIRDLVTYNGKSEKITEIRKYSGEKYEACRSAEAGEIVAVTGLSETLPGMGLGTDVSSEAPELLPVMTYSVVLPPGTDVRKAMTCFRELEEEDPTLHLGWDSKDKTLQIQLMGPIQLEVLSRVVATRFGMNIEFGEGKIVYLETIREAVDGIGHYEPLRHYAEVHLRLEPGERGSGVTVCSECSEDNLDRNWQRLIMTHVMEKKHSGVLTGYPVTDISVVITAGRAHSKHTEGGDFRQATYRAIRQALMKADSVLLEPWYDFRIEMPAENIGRAIADLERIGAVSNSPEISEDYAVLTGKAPVAAIGNYSSVLASYSHGLGKMFCTVRGYEPCVNQESIVKSIAYSAESDVDNTPDSVFCSHGSGFIVKWHDVEKYAHIRPLTEKEEAEEKQERARGYIARAASDDELMAIFERTYGPIKRDSINKVRPARKNREEMNSGFRLRPGKISGPEYLLVDGYNIIFAWKELKEIASVNIDAARDALIDKLRNYQGYRQIPVIVVFDAYKVKGNPGKVEHYGELTVVFTKEAEIADTYIERAAFKLSRNYSVKVATSDRLEQMIILGNGALKISADSFEREVNEAEECIRQVIEEINRKEKLSSEGNRPIITETGNNRSEKKITDK